MTQYPVMEMFYSLQGEGFWSGTAAFFIRLAGCDVRCHWCDVKESWSAENFPALTPEEAITEIKKTPAKHIIITGGEPSMYNLTGLTEKLRKESYKIHIETSGTNKLLGTFDWITLSPKKFKPTLKENFKKANELKIIVYSKHDLIWAKELQKEVSKHTLLFLQPEWSKLGKLKNEIVEFIQETPEWQLSLQTHKFLEIP